MKDATLPRPMADADLEGARALLRQLGYEIDAKEAAARFAAVLGTQGHHLLVAEADGRLRGLLHVFARPALEKPPEAVVQALVIEEGDRGTGVGRVLMEAAESWARAQGFASVAVATNIARDGARAFYRRLGYEPVATSELLRKNLRRPAG